MRKLSILCLIFLQISLQLYANMVPPFQDGSYLSSAISNRNIDILHEKIDIKINPAFTEAKFIVEYTVRSNSTGIIVPLLFQAQDYRGDFKVWFDDNPVEVKKAEQQFNFEQLKSEFYLPDNSNDASNPNLFYLYWGNWNHNNNYSTEHNQEFLKYFEADISEGEHTIRIKYDADVWIDKSGNITKYSFRYSLYPAGFWKSFGGPYITLELEGSTENMTTNLGESLETGIKPINNWSFNQLPSDAIIISWNPPLNTFARVLLFISPYGLAALGALLLIVIYFRIIRKQRKQSPQKRLPAGVVAGALIIPLLVWVLFIFSALLITTVIGKHAVDHGGYLFVSIVYFPLYYISSFIFLFLLFLLADIILKHKLHK